ncbi:DUF1566 domain-containing protein [Leptospira yasudae]|uniref:DUF1566 domain-containing protein n=1 Tax=Leptospira yasudae TaxID=2202201 RepID=A0A6N4QGU9_9LEPT|nr:DUF1566 domain-containing protein [Leptospira yasudae]TGL79114.1 DUF1566 domain-containing protein [Leptospira yasudae]TGL83138.1 DUF1566 domain-containing protein [Leptospira yasudae]TGL85631.1 DUF1566 domain-containing protein [Leptospira yasudae]
MNRTLVLFRLIAGLFLFTSCSEAERISIDASSTAGLLLQGGVEASRNRSGATPDSKEITSFRFNAAENSFAADFVGEISGTQITVSVPFGAIRRLKATFVNTGADVRVNGVSQTSPQTENDFSSSLVYRVIAKNGSFVDYTVNVIPTFRLTDAGQTNCLTTCAAAPGQDAEYSTGVSPSFQSNVILNGYSPQPVTFDRQTGLIWQYCPGGTGGTSCSSTYYYTQPAAAAYCSGLNSMNMGAGYAGLQGWRLPNIEELMTLSTNAAPTSGAYIDLSIFPNGTGGFWSASTNQTDVSLAWGFNFISGVNYSHDKVAGSNHLRCVSGAPIPSPSFTDLNDGTVRDNRTGLVWQKCSVGQVWSSGSTQCATGTVTSQNFAAALNVCETLTLAGRSWRLPNVNELRSLLDFSSSTANAKINLGFFPNTPASSIYGTSNSIPGGGQVQRVRFIDAMIDLASSATNNYTRCVAN